MAVKRFLDQPSNNQSLPKKSKPDYCGPVTLKDLKQKMNNESQGGTVALGTKFFDLTSLGLMLDRMLLQDSPPYDFVQENHQDQDGFVYSIEFKEQFTDNQIRISRRLIRHKWCCFRFPW